MSRSSSSGNSDQIPLRKSTPIHGQPIVSPIDDANERIDRLFISVDRLQSSNKLLKWVATSAITFALGSIIAVARMLYGLGADDATVKANIERAQRQADENKADLRDLSRYVYSRQRPLDGLNQLGPPVKDDR